MVAKEINPKFRFFLDSNSKKNIKKFIPEDVSGTHNTIEIKHAKEYLLKAGFKNIETESIGSKVFKGFCKWAEQAMSQKNHSPAWHKAYEMNLIDYYMIKAKK